MTLAVTEMEQMVKFYSKIFQLNFEKIEMYGSQLYKTGINNIEILFCPAEIAQNTAKQNRHQLEFEVENVTDLTSIVKKYHGQIMNDPIEKDGIIQVGIKDPDKNTLVLKQVNN